MSKTENNEVTMTKTFEIEPERRVTDDMTQLLGVMPPDIVEVLEKINRNDDLIEVIIDLGRVPTARYTDGEYVLLDREMMQEDIGIDKLESHSFSLAISSFNRRSLSNCCLSFFWPPIWPIVAGS